MSPPDLARLAIALAASATLAFAAFSDIRHRRIPNWTSLTLVGLFVLAVATHAGPPLVTGLYAFAVASVATVLLYVLRIVGAGDCKLFSAMALFAGMDRLPELTVATALAGGALGVASLVSRPTRAVVMFQMRGRGDFGRGVPYGVAIATAGLLILWRTP